MNNADENGLILSSGQFYMPLHWNPLMFCSFINPYFANNVSTPLAQPPTFFYPLNQTQKIA